MSPPYYFFHLSPQPRQWTYTLPRFYLIIRYIQNVSYGNRSLTKSAVIADEIIGNRLHLDWVGMLRSGSVGNGGGSGQGQEDREGAEDTTKLHLGG
jgi:hypothetical protein